MKIIFLIIFFFLTNCGYSPIYVNEQLNDLKFADIINKGNKDLNNQIINSLSPTINKQDNSLNILALNSEYKIEQTSKNLKGQVESYRSIVSINLEILRDGQIIKSKKFNKEFSYTNKNNKFDLVQYQVEIKNNLVREIIQDVELYLNKS